jgi:hypothetical protein
MPNPGVFAIAAELNRIANTAEAAGMQAGLLTVAGHVLQRGLARAEHFISRYSPH